jgi:hypothetical protein
MGLNVVLASGPLTAECLSGGMLRRLKVGEEVGYWLSAKE